MQDKKQPTSFGSRSIKQEPAHKGSEATYTGIGGSRGITIGECYAFIKGESKHEVRELNEKNINEEIERFRVALERSEHELKKIEQITIRKLGKSYSDLFQAQIMMLQDPVLIETITRRIKSERKAAYLVIAEEFDRYLQNFKNSDNRIFQDRADDFHDIKNRIIRNLHIRKLHSWIPEGVIVSSDSLSPADIVLLSRSNVKGFVTDSGGKTSHISLICKSLKIPIVVGLGNISEKISTGTPMIIDGSTGTVIIHPEEKTVDRYLKIKEDAKKNEDNTSVHAELPATTKCGVRITFYANIDFKEEVYSITAAGAEGVGLFRSENLFTEGIKVPSESEQHACYQEMAEEIAPMHLDIRLFDIGGDKLIYSPVKEPNPNLGWRGIRILIDLPKILDAQVRAAIRANRLGNIDLLIPMIMSLEEIQHVKASVEKHYSELMHESDTQLEKPGVGAMVELPAAVELIDEITRCVDFISIGTNDLTQYTLAVDRNNVIVQDLFEKFHPAIIRQLHRIITTANTNHCKVMICGDMGSDPLALPFLLGCGLRKFSVVVSDIPNLKSLVSHYTLTETEALAQECLRLNTAAGIKACLEDFQAKH
ncbi:MAG: phosphoenolpyruvate--protein phosphotransferase [Chlorobium sp.]|nr:MAG: phosphoenolpyruvate--protein phosphotransferase [Chlorobium sp.]